MRRSLFRLRRRGRRRSRGCEGGHRKGGKGERGGSGKEGNTEQGPTSCLFV